MTESYEGKNFILLQWISTRFTSPVLHSLHKPGRSSTWWRIYSCMCCEHQIMNGTYKHSCNDLIHGVDSFHPYDAIIMFTYFQPNSWHKHILSLSNFQKADQLQAIYGQSCTSVHWKEMGQQPNLAFPFSYCVTNQTRRGEILSSDRI